MVQRSVTFSFVVIGEASTKIMHKFPDFIGVNDRVAGKKCEGCETSWLMVISILTMIWFGIPFKTN